MSKNYIITLECSKDALAELIATGLERHATITIVEAAVEQEPAPQPEPRPVHRVTVQARPKRAPEPVLRGTYYDGPRSRISSPKKVSGWDIYQVVVDCFHPQKTFRSRDLREECKRAGFDVSQNSASAHLARFREADLVKKVGGNRMNGLVHTVCPVVTRSEFDRRR